jgi:ankyrin repeat protein
MKCVKWVWQLCLVFSSFQLIASSDDEMIERPLHVKYEVDTIVDDYGRTQLHYAALGGSINDIEDLLWRGANPGAQDDNGDTPITIAERRGHDHIAKRLKEHLKSLELPQTPPVVASQPEFPTLLSGFLGTLSVFERSISDWSKRQQFL